MFYRIRCTALAVAVVIIGWLAASPVASAQLRGGIFTTDFRGAIVNQNHFALKEAVFLNGGGPAVFVNGGLPRLRGPKLPPGRYYFQVTDPNGRVLLSTDQARCRQVVVGASGKIVGVPGESACEHPLGSDEYPGDPRPHDIPVQLAPFANSPNSGGIYKAWLIAQRSAVSRCNPTVNVDGKSLNFDVSCAKTDNFKVDRQREPACAAWVDNFDGNTLNPTRWARVSGIAPGSLEQVSSTFDPNNVSVGGGLLRLTMTQVLTPNGSVSIGALVRTFVPCGYGTYEWTMRMGSSTTGPGDPGTNLSGGVSAGFTFWNNSEHEIVFEHSAAPSGPPESIWFVNFKNTDPGNPLHDPEAAGEGTVTQQALADVYNVFHHYKFVWIPGSIKFYIDNVFITEHTDNVPVVPGFFQMSYFGRNFANWGGLATAGTRHFFVTRAAYTPLP